MAVALTEFLKYVRPEVPGCPEPMLVDAALRTCIEFCTRTELLSEIVELDTVDGVNLYTISPSDPTLHYPARLRDALVDGLPLTKSDAAAWGQLPERVESGQATHYHAPTRNRIAIAPIPNAVETIELDIVLRPDRDATTVDDVLYDEWASTIAMGAKAELMLMAGAAWANPELGAYYKQRFEGDLGTAAVQVAQGNVGAPMHISPTEI